MKISQNGLMEIVSHEGICLEPYLDSVGVWTIGIGQTAFDGFNPRTTAKMTLDQVFDLFKRKLKTYTDAVDALGLDLKQHQYDALVSFCYNVGAGNLQKLCRNRSIAQIGDAIMLYRKPPEIIPRREKEQRLFKHGIYSNVAGKGLVFPVRNSKPRYSEGYTIDLKPYFGTASKPAITFEKITPPPAKPAAAPKPSFWAALLSLFTRKV